VFYAAVAWFANGYYHADEHFQIIEFAGIKTGANTPNDLSFEYREGIRPALQPTIAYVLLELQDVFTSNPYLKAFFLRLLTAIIGLIAIRLFVKATLFLVEQRLQKAYILSSYFIWFMPLIFTRFSSEAWSAIFIIFATTFLINSKLLNTRNVFSIGILLGLAFLFRYQSAFISIGLIAWLLYNKRLSLKGFLQMSSAILAIALIGIFIDSWFYEKWIITAWNYFNFNILEDGASTFGTKPFLWYPYAIIKYTFLPIGILIGLSFLYLLLERRKSIFLFIFLPMFLVHCLIPHKEIRFLFPLAFIVTPIIFLFVQYIFKSTKTIFPNRFVIPTLAIIALGFITVANSIGLVALVSKTAGARSIHTGKYIYDNFNGNAITLHQTQFAATYAPFGVPLNFYKVENLKTRTIKSPCELNPDDINTSNINLVTFAFKDKLDTTCIQENSSLKFTKLTQSWPDWLVTLNGFYRAYETPEQTYLYKVELKR
jgi:phosphatidylinositol glycan class B